MRVRALAVVLGATIVALATPAQPAVAFQLRNCVGSFGSCQGAPNHSLSGDGGLVVSPDGKHVYTGARDYDVIATFTRNKTTGALKYGGCQSGGGQAGCTDVNSTTALDSVRALAISPDGKDLYAVAEDGDAIAVFGRNSNTGALNFEGCVSADGLGGCSDVQNTNALNGPQAVTVTPDGRFVYVTTGAGDAVTVFKRDTVTGAVHAEGCMGTSGSGPCLSVADAFALDDPLAPIVSPDKKHLYVAARTGGAVTAIGRNTDNGSIGFASCLRAGAESAKCAATGHGAVFDAVDALTIAPGGAQVYSASFGGTVAWFTRNALNGALSFANCANADGSSGCVDAPSNSLDGGIGDIAITPDGRRVYVESTIHAVTMFSRNGTTGALAYRACISDGFATPCSVPPKAGALGVPIALEMAPDGRHLYVRSTFALITIGIQPARCSPLTAATPLGRAIKVKLPCVDPDGGDPLKFTVAGAKHGQLGAVDHATGTVLYAPNPGFVGVERLTFGASDIEGSSSALATISVGRIFGKSTRVSLSLRSKRIPGSGPVPVRVRNRNGFRVTGSLRGTHAKTALPARSLAVPPNDTRTVKLPLPQKLRDALRRTGELDLRLIATVRDTTAHRRTVKRKVTAELK